MQELYLGWEKVSFLERRPQFRSVLIERERERFHCSNNPCECERVYLSLSISTSDRRGRSQVLYSELLCSDKLVQCVYLPPPPLLPTN